ncbi:uncharacterized protein [Diadema antillarum]|uniref:uncharacterized protein n=1 Tax=Diadema antillarum TaxID=105358 RepID=UPI003A8ADB27
MSSQSDPVYIFLAFWVFIEYLAVVVINVLASLPDDPTGWFKNQTGDISDKYYVDINPAGWAFSIWSVIYVWQALWIIYAIVNIFRSNKFGKVYLNPPTVSPVFLVTYTLNLVFNITWLFLWDRQYLPIATPCLALITFTLYLCLWFNHRAVAKYIDQLRDHSKVDLWLNRILIQNGLTTYATWCTIATLLNFTSTIVYFADVEQKTACLLSLSILTVELLLFVILDNFVWDKYLRSTFMAYPVVIWASTASLVNNWNPENPVSIFNAVVVGLAGAAFVFKNIMLVVRACREEDACASKTDGNKVPLQDVA